jgi:hypothetical protein
VDRYQCKRDFGPYRRLGGILLFSISTSSTITLRAEAHKSALQRSNKLMAKKKMEKNKCVSASLD